MARPPQKVPWTILSMTLLGKIGIHCFSTGNELQMSRWRFHRLILPRSHQSRRMRGGATTIAVEQELVSEAAPNVCCKTNLQQKEPAQTVITGKAHPISSKERWSKNSAPPHTRSSPKVSYCVRAMGISLVSPLLTVWSRRSEAVMLLGVRTINGSAWLRKMWSRRSEVVVVAIRTINSNTTWVKLSMVVTETIYSNGGAPCNNNPTPRAPPMAPPPTPPPAILPPLTPRTPNPQHPTPPTPTPTTPILATTTISTPLPAPPTPAPESKQSPSKPSRSACPTFVLTKTPTLKYGFTPVRATILN
mmetsp:Transcript_35316/g.61984  ORF Transcript_35316/g.61984 Transcript_35316/m.61984 type:complete len:304 (+) Transcript_35316:1040-1951(+)